MLKWGLFSLFLWIFIPLQLKAITHGSAFEVWDKLNLAIGRTIPAPPEILIKYNLGTPAVYSPTKKTVTIDEGFLILCDSFGPDSLNAFAYVIAHELIHHYWEHGVNFMGNFDFGLSIPFRGDEKTQTLRYEAEADLRAGFFAQIAGYESLRVAPDFLSAIYKTYNIPVELEGYPSLAQRQEISRQKYIELLELWNFFELGTFCYQLELNELATACFEEILKADFTSAEIYNNAAASVIKELRLLHVNDELAIKWLPPSLELESNLPPLGLTRALGLDVEKQLKRAEVYLHQALTLNPRFEKARYNKFVYQVHEAYFLGKSLPDAPEKDVLKALEVDPKDIEAILKAIGKGKSHWTPERKSTYSRTDYFSLNSERKSLASKDLFLKLVDEFSIVFPSNKPLYQGSRIKIYNIQADQEIITLIELKGAKTQKGRISFLIKRGCECEDGYMSVLSPDGSSVCIAWASW